MCQTRQPRIQNITVKISHLQPLESKGMQLPASAHLRRREAFIKEETHRTVPFLCLLRLICGRRGRQNQPSGPPPPPLIHPQLSGNSHRTPPQKNTSRGASAADLFDRSLFQDRQRGDFDRHHRTSRRLSGSGGLRGSFTDVHPPHKSKIFCGNECFFCNNAINHLIFSVA